MRNIITIFMFLSIFFSVQVLAEAEAEYDEKYDELGYGTVEKKAVLLSLVGGAAISLQLYSLGSDPENGKKNVAIFWGVTGGVAILLGAGFIVQKIKKHNIDVAYESDFHAPMLSYRYKFD